MSVRKFAAAPIGVMVAVALLLAAAQAEAKWKAPAPRYYLALGDSLSQGVQPNVNGLSLETNQGYADQLYANLRGRIKNLKLVKMGCPGDTTTSMLTGKGNAIAAKFFKCNRTGGSQVKAAQRFLKAHHKKGEVVLVTLDIGANDVDGCTAPGVNVAKCVTTGQNNIKTLTPKILKAIRTSAATGTKLAAMTLYDPVLGGYFSASPTARALASASVGLLKGINNTIASANKAGGFLTADVAGAFASYSTATVPALGTNIPLNVARVCAWTWACTTPPSGPNIHANKNGYAVIASAFQKVIGKVN
jgi:lysophospholipase L1-like esterase